MSELEHRRAGMKRRKFEILDFGDEVVLVPIDEDIELQGLLKLGKSAKEIMKEIREEEWILEERKLRRLGLL
ncbi:hypothetical protein AMR53_04180 [Thermococcus thioreducens]|uniref:Uncharacterized protein n=2 Tax=Thermococcus thioreducens TaxID=277988 RepID=A0A0Q2RFQ6_9EURY|nr:hypothetical protein AMR53_04180 [Thermococcus thioreducens]